MYFIFYNLIGDYMKDRCVPFFKVIFFVFIILFLIIKLIIFKIFNSNYILIRSILNNSNHFISPNYSFKDKLNDLLLYVTNYNFSNPVSLFKSSYEFKKIFNDKLEMSSKGEDLIESYDYSNEVISDPLVYIYNTHQKEEYVDDVSDFKPTVYTAAYLLHDELLKRGINSIVEDGDITMYLQDNGMNYDDSYLASRTFLEKVMNEYKSIKLFIDLHRDAITHDDSTAYYDNKAFSKVLFVVGLDNSNHQGNLNLANHLNDLISKKYPYLTRGVLTKSGPLVNGIYNQDLNSNIILLEVGGNESNISEVSNSLCLISDIIYDYLGE